MRRLLNKIIKKEKKEQEKLDNKILTSKEFKALEIMNIIMNSYDAIERLGYDSLDGDEYYIHARFQAHAFMETLVTKLLPPTESKENDQTITVEV